MIGAEITTAGTSPTPSNMHREREQAVWPSAKPWHLIISKGRNL